MITKSTAEEASVRYRHDARKHEREGRIDAAWACFEAAHIVGQRSTLHHLVTHAAMLGLAWRTRDVREFIGQLGRLVAATVITWIWVPAGNSGRANVSALASSPLPEDIAELLTAATASSSKPETIRATKPRLKKQT